MHAWMKRVRRIKRNVEDGTIADFLSHCTIQELWQITPAVWHELPADLQQLYCLIDSHQHLTVLYGGCEELIRPMLAGLFRRWQSEQPEKVSAVLATCSEFIQHQRDAALTSCDAV